jgi:trimethylamine--corrinoid protein Co-methyltransferase
MEAELIEAVNYTTRLELLPEKSIQDIHAASLWILENTGLIMPLSRERRDQASDLGLDVDRETNRIHFPAQVVEAAITRAPTSYTLCARDPDNDLLLDGKHGYLSLDGSGTQALDPEKAKRAIRPRPTWKLQPAWRMGCRRSPSCGRQSALRIVPHGCKPYTNWRRS